MENLKIITKHFSRDSKANVVYQENACPSTDGRNITLPTRVNSEYADETIGAMLHETSHIRYTNFDSLPDLTPAEHDCLNVLEDIRIDHKTCQEYPNARFFYDCLRDEVINTKKDKLLKEPTAVQVLKSLIIHAEGIDPSTLYTDPKTLKLFEKYKGLVGISQQSKSTDDLVDYAKQLAKQLFDDIRDKGASDKLDEELGELGKDLEELGEKFKENSDKLDEQESKSSTIKKKATSKFNQAAKQIDKAKADELIEEAKKLDEELDKSNEKLNKLDDKKQKLTEEYRGIEQQQREKERKKRMEQSDGFRRDPDAEIKGFTALDNAKVLKDDKGTVNSTVTLDELIAEKVIARRDQVINDDEGVVLNQQKLHDLYTDVDELFEEDEVKQYKTKIAFIIDTSGSMGNVGSVGDRANLCLNVAKLFADAIKKASLSGAPVEFTIFGFSDNTAKLCDLDNYDPDKLSSQYQQAAYDLGGGTELVECVNFVTDDLSANLDTDSDAVAIVLTDAEIGSHQMKELVNKANSQDVKFVFIAITPSTCTQKEDEFQEVFGDNVITSHEESDVVDCITRVMLDWS